MDNCVNRLLLTHIRHKMRPSLIKYVIFSSDPCFPPFFFSWHNTIHRNPREETVNTVPLPWVHDHVNRFQKWFEMENWKTCVFRFDWKYFLITDIGNHDLKPDYCEWEEDTCPENFSKLLLSWPGLKFSKFDLECEPRSVFVEYSDYSER